MGKKLSGLRAWMGRQGRPGLWAAAVALALVNGMFGFELMYIYPFLPFNPWCWDDSEFFLADGFRTLDGRMKGEFQWAVEKRFRANGVPYRQSNGELLVTFADWWVLDYGFGGHRLHRMSWETTGDIIRKRFGKDSQDVPERFYAARNPDIEDSWYDERECPTMRLIAMLPEGAEPFYAKDDPFWKERLKAYREATGE